MDHSSGENSFATYNANFYANNIYGILELDQFSYPAKFFPWKDGSSGYSGTLYNKRYD